MRKFMKVRDDAILPTRATSRSAGYDLHAYIQNDLKQLYIHPGERVIVMTGVTVQLNPDEELQVRPRSGIAARNGLTVLNTPGTVDADYYPNEIGVILFNTSRDVFVVNHGDRIAQGVFAKYLLTDDDDATGERQGGFGHTGI